MRDPFRSSAYFHFSHFRTPLPTQKFGFLQRFSSLDRGKEDHISGERGALSTLFSTSLQAKV